MLKILYYSFVTYCVVGSGYMLFKLSVEMMRKVREVSAFTRAADEAAP
jgi:hypothetical protein